MDQLNRTIIDLASSLRGKNFHTVLADPPWRFTNRTGKVAPEHRRLTRYETMWVPNALLPEGLAVMKAWGFDYKSNIVWHKIRKDGGSDGRGVGFYFRNATEVLLFGTRGKNARTLAPGRRQVNMIETRKREHSRKPDEQYDVIESRSRGPYLELFARGTRPGWTYWGNQANEEYAPTWDTYANHSQAGRIAAEPKDPRTISRANQASSPAPSAGEEGAPTQLG
jgi:hypothetical protein